MIEWKHKSVRKLIKEHRAEGLSDPFEIVVSMARDLVLKAYTRGWGGPPFDVLELCEILGIEVTPNEMVTDARILTTNKGFQKIEYNPFKSQKRINFSLAHEIGHTLFSDCGETVRNRLKGVEPESWELEFLCNVAAAEILLPYARFSKEANEVELSLQSILEISDIYQASLESVFLRFVEVVNKPCAVAFGTFQGKHISIEYSKSSRASNLNIPKGYAIPNESSFSDCLKPGWTTHELVGWDVMGNTRYRVYGIGLPAIKKQTAPRVGLFFVPEFYDSVPESSIFMVNGDATEPRGAGIKIIGQVVNTSAGVGVGFGKALAKKYPDTKVALQRWKQDKMSFKLGEIQLIEVDKNVYVAQILAQKGLFPQYGEIPLKYDSLHEGVKALAVYANQLEASIHIPLIGAGQANGDWDIIQGIIYEELVKKGIAVTVYVLPGSKLDKKQNSVLTLFDETSLNE